VDSAARAWLEAGNKAAAAGHFEQALALDPLLVPDIDALLKIYRESGDKAKETALMDRVQAAMRLNTHTVPPKR
jgi:two-component SAPR family response regulator